MKINRIRIIAGLLFFMLLVNANLIAQPLEKVYKTLSGNIGIRAVYDGSAVTASSDKLVVTLDHDLATILFHLDFNTLKTENDSFQHIFYSQIPLLLSFKGKFDRYYLDVDQAPMDLEVTGRMILNGIERDMLIKGEMNYYPQNDISARLSLNFDLNLIDFQLAERFPGFHPIMKVEIAQAVLKQE